MGASARSVGPGRGRTNQTEAKAIVDAAVRRLRDPQFVDWSGRPLSLGIITMNIEQMHLVEDLLDQARGTHPDHLDEIYLTVLKNSNSQDYTEQEKDDLYNTLRKILRSAAYLQDACIEVLP